MGGKVPASTAGAPTRSSRSLMRTVIVAWALFTSACAAPSADTIFLNGKIFTSNPSAPWASALAVRGERIVAIGAAAAVAPFDAPSTRHIDLAGRVMVPGFNDAHVDVADPTVESVRLLGADALAGGVTSLQVFSATPVRETVGMFREADLPLRVRILRMPQPEAEGVTRDSRPYLPPQPSPLLDVRGMGFALAGGDRQRLLQAVGWAYGSEDPLAIQPLDRQTLDGYAGAIEQHGAVEVWRLKRPRVELPGEISADMLVRLQRLGVMVVQQPRSGAPLRSIHGAGVRLALGSAGAPRGFSLLALATTLPGGEALSMADAIDVYAAGSAAAQFAERDKGRLAVGTLADLAVLSADPFSASVEELGRIRSVFTMIGGRSVYDVPRPPHLSRSAAPRQRPRRDRGAGRSAPRSGRDPSPRDRRRRPGAAVHQRQGRGLSAGHQPVRHRAARRAGVRRAAAAASSSALVHLAETLLPPTPAKLWGARDVGARAAEGRHAPRADGPGHRGGDRRRAARSAAGDDLLARGRRPVHHAAARLHAASRRAAATTSACIGCRSRRAHDRHALADRQGRRLSLRASPKRANEPLPVDGVSRRAAGADPVGDRAAARERARS